MMKQITPWLKGVLAPVLVMVIFAIPVGVFMALALLVFAMEEGGETMSSFAVPLTRVIVLLLSLIHISNHIHARSDCSPATCANTFRR